MSKLTVSFGIGVLAGIVDAVPMVVQKLDRLETASAFVHWVVLGFLISYIRIPVPSWLKGILVAEMTAVPILLLAWKSDPASAGPILAMSAVLGTAVGLLTEKYAR